ncbi:methyl-accepting chemotaxis protein [Psychrosphaera aestuarii]|uniref:methyl-accepting chemotaxis protein n=1 Tax=Psychrosphaera aestuarii TaxID=1266052 RepID=UPI001B3196E6|nr:methyl-accepting chemotaxis protein [Psychrosphaera aestuarii]
MKLTVAMRVIGGFSITAILLLFLGFSSVAVLNDISKSTETVNNLSVPAMESSAALQQQFVAMSKTTLLDYYADNYNDIEGSVATFNSQATEMDKELNSLTSIVAGVDILESQVPKVKKSFQEFTASAYQLFTAKKNTLELADKVISQLEETEFAADDAATLILDFTDLNELPSDNPAAQAATSIEANMLSIITAITDISKNNNRDTVITIRKELDFLQDNMNKSVAVLKTETAGKGYEGVSSLLEQIDLVNRMIDSNDSVGATKIALLNKIDETRVLLNKTTQLSEQSIVQLKSLGTKVKEELQITTESVKDAVGNGVSQNWAVMGVSLLFSIFIGYKTVVRVTRPLSEVNEVLNVVSTGDLTVKLDDSNNDEFGELAKNCNKLIDSLRELIHGIVSRSNQLATASEETSMVVKESTVAINEQRSQVEQAATATTEMASTSYSVMDRANEALADIKQADEDAERVKTISDNNKQTILSLASEIEQASGVIHEVNEHSAAIGGILDVIRGIAEQTNLLALNAAIEAARAGEQGRGFAVVADEVRSLASKTQESTQEIQNMIEQLQRGSKSAVSVMNHSKTQADLCVSQTEQATLALNNITDSVHQANDMSEQIVSAAKEQNQVSNEISERLESIVAIAEQTASGATQTDLSSQEVARLAEELRQSVEQFRL